MNTSAHAIQRMGQRGVNQFMVDLVMEFGCCEYHKGCEIYLMTKSSCRRVNDYIGHQFAKQLLSKIIGVYVVISEGTILTVARKNNHFKKNRK
ncbi:hypothetical protein [Shewanella sp. KJ2020]|uniref:hypothetical protein n=1 Tax=Shewanella sp. KJ2020 TaxID=2919172 RepID=UPI0020A82B41|nr:hypothetical protein [Shewanella sp. KJ2020]MCP3127662.1 hypothetical protein [Shewanella sp. KJ2020]